MNIEIIDRLAKPKAIKPIKLLGCLQSSLSDEAPHFCCKLGEDTPAWPAPFGVSKVERVFSQNIDGIVYDVMIISRGDKNPCLFIGQWNDGVWGE